MDEHALERLEFGRVIAEVAGRAQSEAARDALLAARPIRDREARAAETRLVGEAIRRVAAPGTWVEVGTGRLGWRLSAQDGAGTSRLDGPGLVEVGGWLAAAEATRGAWRDAEVAATYPVLAGRVAGIPDLGALRRALETALDPDGRLRDGASPALRKARAALTGGERDLERRLERWARGFGADSYVTRHGDRFVALVPAAGFPRRRGIVHDVSGSGQSLFVEPIEACADNNRLIELRAAVDAEERRILLGLADAVRAARPELEALESVLVHLDGLRARACWALDVGGTAVAPGGAALRLRGARHPLLASGAQRDQVVPLDLELGDAGRLLLVSGPNMGGKTVLLKTVGLSFALSHAAFPVPAEEGSAIPEVDELIVDLGDEQSLDHGLSTFAAHLRTLGRMAREAGPRTALLCDELGAGTDPEEGAALGRALVERFAERGAWGVVTSHLGSLKRLAGAVPGVVNGSLAFDLDTMTPRYRFIPGVPGASHALAMAERLGLDADLVARARACTPDEARAIERLIAELQSAQVRLDEARAASEAARDEAERAAADHREAAEDARRSVAGLRRRLTAESDKVLAQARELWQTIQREARRADKARANAARLGEEVRGAEGALESLDRDLDRALASVGGVPETPRRPLAFDEVVPGARVRVADLGVEAEVVARPDAEGRVLLQRGAWRITSRLDQLRPAASDTEAPSAGARAPTAAASWEMDEAPPVEVDLRGLDVEEALRALDDGLDRAVLGGLSELRIIHGIGKGVLRAAVQEHLKAHPNVQGQRLGQAGEGGRGVSVAKLG